MINRYKLVIWISATLLFTACGGGGSASSAGSNTDSASPAGSNTDSTSPDGSSTQTQTTAMSMQAGESYTMNTGDVIVKLTDPTVVVLETDIQTGITTAVLQSGSANIEQ